MITFHERTDSIAGIIVEGVCDLCGAAVVSWPDHDAAYDCCRTVERQHECAPPPGGWKRRERRDRA